MSKQAWNASVRKEAVEKKARFSHWLRTQYLNWQVEEQDLKTVVDFSAHLGEGRATVAMWLSGRRLPTGDSAHRLAAKLGPEVYDILGLKRPNLELARVIAAWDKLPASVRKRILSSLEPD